MSSLCPSPHFLAIAVLITNSATNVHGNGNDQWNGTCDHGISSGDLYDPDSPFFNKRCICDAGWSGVHCNISRVLHCGKHGSKSGKNGRCECEKRYNGKKCDRVIECRNGQLSNGRCICRYGWKDDFCETIICRFGETMLTSNVKEQRCVCNAGITGQHCDFCASNENVLPPECLKPENQYDPYQYDPGEDNDNGAHVIKITLGIGFAALIGVTAVLMIGWCNRTAKQANLETEERKQETRTEQRRPTRLQVQKPAAEGKLLVKKKDTSILL